MRVRGTLQSTEATDLPPLNAIFLRVQPKSEPISIDIVQPVVSHHSQLECAVPMSGSDQTIGRSVEESHPFASATTSELSGFQCNKSVFSVSYATLLLLMQILVCCIDRLKPQDNAASHKPRHPTGFNHTTNGSFCLRSGHP